MPWIYSACCPCLTCILLVRTELLYHTVRSRTGQKHCVKQQWPPSIFFYFWVCPIWPAGPSSLVCHITRLPGRSQCMGALMFCKQWGSCLEKQPPRENLLTWKKACTGGAHTHKEEFSVLYCSPRDLFLLFNFLNVLICKAIQLFKYILLQGSFFHISNTSMKKTRVQMPLMNRL